MSSPNTHRKLPHRPHARPKPTGPPLPPAKPKPYQISSISPCISPTSSPGTVRRALRHPRAGAASPLPPTPPKRNNPVAGRRPMPAPRPAPKKADEYIDIDDKPATVAVEPGYLSLGDQSDLGVYVEVQEPLPPRPPPGRARSGTTVAATRAPVPIPRPRAASAAAQLGAPPTPKPRPPTSPRPLHRSQAKKTSSGNSDGHGPVVHLDIGSTYDDVDVDEPLPPLPPKSPVPEAEDVEEPLPPLPPTPTTSYASVITEPSELITEDIYDAVENEDDNHGHTWQIRTFEDRVNCMVCDTLLKGMVMQGFQCETCARAIHKRCIMEAGPCTGAPGRKRSRRQRTSSTKISQLAGVSHHDEVYESWSSTVGSGDSGILMGDDIYAEVEDEEEEPSQPVVAFGPARRRLSSSLKLPSQDGQNDASHLLSPMAPRKTWASSLPAVELGILDTMTKGEIKRQEALFEFVCSEEKYLDDLQTLKSVFLLPLRVHYESTRPKGGELVLPENLIQDIIYTSGRLHQTGVEFLSQLKERCDIKPVVETLSDLLLEAQPRLQEVLLPYSEAAVRIMFKLDHSSKAFQDFVALVEADPNAKHLPFQAYLLAPLQRLARYPILLEAVLDNTDKAHHDNAALTAAHDIYKTMVMKCNADIKQVEDVCALSVLNESLDLTRLSHPIPVEGRTEEGDVRTISKRGKVHLVRLLKKKIIWSKSVELMVFSDLLQYAKIVKQKKTGDVKYFVCMQAHRMLCDVRPVKGHHDTMFEIVVYSDKDVMRLTFQTDSEASRARWLDALDPSIGTDDTYSVVDCPLLKADVAYTAQSEDEVNLEKGDIIFVTRKDVSGWMKGTVESTGQSGWFPASTCHEKITLHTRKKIFKARHITI